MERTIAMFVKEPVAGAVKSRLAEVIGSDDALALYQCFVLDMIETLRSVPARLIVFYAPADAGDRMRSWLGPEVAYAPQEGADLGERMEAAFRSVFSRGSDAAVLVGSDIPDLPPAVVEEAFAALASSDLALGPASDGGYYLVGFRDSTFEPAIFRGIAWSTPQVLAETLRIAKELGHSVHLMPEWHDVDTISDLAALTKRGSGCRRTREFLAGRQELLPKG